MPPSVQHSNASTTSRTPSRRSTTSRGAPTGRAAHLAGRRSPTTRLSGRRSTHAQDRWSALRRPRSTNSAYPTGGCPFRRVAPSRGLCVGVEARRQGVVLTARVLTGSPALLRMLTVGKLSEVSEPPLNVAARRVRPGHDKMGLPPKSRSRMCPFPVIGPKSTSAVFLNVKITRRGCAAWAFERSSSRPCAYSSGRTSLALAVARLTMSVKPIPFSNARSSSHPGARGRSPARRRRS